MFLNRSWVVGVSLVALAWGTEARAQAAGTLPPVVVQPPPAQVRTPRKPRVAARPMPARQSTVRTARRPENPRGRPVAIPGGVPQGAGVGGTAQSPERTAAAAFDRARANTQPRLGVNAYDLGRDAIDNLPQGSNATLDKVLLQLPGVTQDSANSGSFHIRNEHGNAQFRINGVFLPEGVSGFGQLVETSFIGNLALLDGALPAQYGLRTAGIIDITSRSGAFDNGGQIGLYGGGQRTLSPTFEYGGTSGPWQYFFTGRLFLTREGVENTTPASTPLHDFSRQGRYFGYATAQLDDITRLSIISGASISQFQIPSTPGQVPAFTAFGVSDLDSSGLRERQIERNYYNVVAVQRSVGDIDAQFSAFSRYSSVRFTPDLLGDLVFNGVASNVDRRSQLYGIQNDIAYRLGTAHTLRFGLSLSSEQTVVANSSFLQPLGEDGTPLDAPFNQFDKNSKTGYLIGTYVQDEWKVTDTLTLNTGLRFDQMYQFVDANQLSPRVNAVYKPFEGTTFHAGYSRYFTPPNQALSAPTNLAAFGNTTLQPDIGFGTPVKPERSNYFDVGVVQRVLPGLDIGVDGYYKQARNLLDDGQFGQALVLTTFNYDRAYNYGVEFKANYAVENFRIYGNLALAQQKAKRVTSNQFLLDSDEFAYISDHYVYTDHAQNLTASAGISYRWQNTRISADLIYGSGLRSGFANTDHVPSYAQVNLGLAQDIPTLAGKPATIRFDIVNLFDHVYQVRDGSGIGVFAPQYGPRRTFFAGVSQRF